MGDEFELMKDEPIEIFRIQGVWYWRLGEEQSPFPDWGNGLTPIPEYIKKAFEG